LGTLKPLYLLGVPHVPNVPNKKTLSKLKKGLFNPQSFGALNHRLANGIPYTRHHDGFFIAPCSIASYARALIENE
jgi:hypothetical protein